jgi:hypothetical protein
MVNSIESTWVQVINFMWGTAALPQRCLGELVPLGETSRSAQVCQELREKSVFRRIDGLKRNLACNRWTRSFIVGWLVKCSINLVDEREPPPKIRRMHWVWQVSSLVILEEDTALMARPYSSWKRTIWLKPDWKKLVKAFMVDADGWHLVHLNLKQCFAFENTKTRRKK